MMTSLRSKWAAGKARGGRISKLIRNRRATQPPAHFHRNPLGRSQLAVFPRCSLLTYGFRYTRRSRLEKQPTDLRRKACLFRGQDSSATLGATSSHFEKNHGAVLCAFSIIARSRAKPSGPKSPPKNRS